MRRSRTGLVLATLMAAVAVSRCGSPGESGKSSGPTAAPPQGRNNLVVAVSAPDVARLAIEVRSSEWTPLKHDIKAANGRAVGGVFVPPGGSREIVITAFDANGVETHRGSDQRTVGEVARGFAIALRPARTGDALVAELSTERVEIDRTGQEGGAVTLRARVIDPDGQPVKFDLLDIRWRLSDVRDYRLAPVPGDGGVVVTPASTGRPAPVRLCIPPGTVVACRLANCGTIDICRDPWVNIAAGGEHTCGLTRAGVAFCWGRNTDGELGVTTQDSCGGQPCSPKPIPVTCAPGAPCVFKQIAAGAVRTCAIDANNDAWCWGFGSTTRTRLQAQLAGATVKFTSITVGFSHVCALSDRNDIWCAGENYYGQIGLPRATTQQVALSTPQRILAPLHFKKVVAGDNHTCAIAQDGTSMACWGDNTDRQALPANAPTPFPSESTCSCTSSPVWQPLGGGVTVETAAAGPRITCARLSTGETRCWGINASLLGFPSTQPVTRVTAGDVHVCGLVSQAALCMGNGFFGQVGNNAISYQSMPVAVSTPPTAYSDIAAGRAHTCGITTTGDAFCWGRNDQGQLGIGMSSSAGSLVPALVVR